MRGAREPNASDVLADRIAAMLVDHDPGWRVPRPSALARRHNVGIGEVHAAFDQLVARRLVRRGPDGQLYRASPAEYLIPLEGTARLGTRVDPMRGDLRCLSYSVSLRPAPEDAASALRIAPAEPVCVLRLAWAVDDLPAAVSTAYLPGHLTSAGDEADWLTAAAEHGVLPLVPPGVMAGGNLLPHPDCPPHAASVQMQLPPAAVARTLRLSPCQMAVLVTVLFRHGGAQQPAALTATVLRPDVFRIVLDTAPPSTADTAPLSAGWHLVVADDAT